MNGLPRFYPPSIASQDVWEMVLVRIVRLNGSVVYEDWFHRMHGWTYRGSPIYGECRMEYSPDLEAV